jgi:hypothetical protein
MIGGSPFQSSPRPDSSTPLRAELRPSSISMAAPQSVPPNQRDGVDAGWRILFGFGCQWPGATHRER